MLLLRSAALMFAKGMKSGQPLINILPKAVPKALMADCVSFESLRKFLNLAESSQINLGVSLSSNVRGSSPSLRARLNLRSACEEADSSADSLHHSGQAALMADSVKPVDLISLFLNSPALIGVHLKAYCLVIYSHCTCYSCAFLYPKRFGATNQLAK